MQTFPKIQFMGKTFWCDSTPLPRFIDFDYPGEKHRRYWTRRCAEVGLTVRFISVEYPRKLKGVWTHETYKSMFKSIDWWDSRPYHIESTTQGSTLRKWGDLDETVRRLKALVEEEIKQKALKAMKRLVDLEIKKAEEKYGG